MSVASSADSFDLNSVPPRMRAMVRWICWKLVIRDGKDTKVPIDPATGRALSVKELSRGVPIDAAIDAWRRNASMSGIGFVFAEGDGFVGIDLDDCVDEHGTIAPGALSIIARFASYAEISPSGTGVKIFIEGTKPAGAKRVSAAIEGIGKIEIYSAKRYFTVTARRLLDAPADVMPAQEALDELCARLWPKKERAKRANRVDRAALEDEEILDRARSAKNGEKFRRLWEGDTSGHGGDESAADMALALLIAFWTTDESQVDRLFRRSGLMRDKWDERRGDSTYGRLTIRRALELRASGESWNGGDRGGDGSADDGVGAGMSDASDDSTRHVFLTERTVRTVETFIAEFHSHPDGLTIMSYAGELREWKRNRYMPIEEGEMSRRLHRFLDAALRERKLPNGGTVLENFPSNPTTVEAAIRSLRALAHVDGMSTPCWRGDRADRPSPHDIISFPTNNLDLRTGELFAATPALLTMSALDIDLDPSAAEPALWLSFLNEVFPSDAEAVATLQEWFGLSLTLDMSQQKMLLLIGPKRSGKGTIARVLRALAGEPNVVNPTTGSLADRFGLQQLIGKSLAIIGDARFCGPHVGSTIERLLSISGQDAIGIDRKYLGVINVRLTVRFMIVSNEVPRLPDSSGAIASRFIALVTSQSFYGKEDPALTDKLLAELPGILNWSLEGIGRLRTRGKFLQPRSGQTVVGDLLDLGSPISAFVRDRCVAEAGARVFLDDLFSAWRQWCQGAGMEPGTVQLFARNLRAFRQSLDTRRGTNDRRFCQGIRLGRGHP